MRRHITQMRHAYPFRFASDDAQQAYAAEVERFRSEMPYRYGVAPRVGRYTTPSGRVVDQRQRVTLADFRGGSMPAYRLLADAVLRGYITESDRVVDDDESETSDGSGNAA